MLLWLAAEPLVLASTSRARQMMLTAAGVSIEVCEPSVDERQVESVTPWQSPGVVATLLAREKACDVEQRNPGRLVLGADQILALGSQRFAKPVDRAAARAQLHALCGRTHELYSAIAFVQNAKVLFEHVDVARLTMRSFSDKFLELYLRTIGSTAAASVGAYELEGLGVQLFERVQGDYFTVLGLPLLAALDFLRRQGLLLP